MPSTGPGTSQEVSKSLFHWIECSNLSSPVNLCYSWVPPGHRQKISYWTCVIAKHGIPDFGRICHRSKNILWKFKSYITSVNFSHHFCLVCFKDLRFLKFKRREVMPFPLVLSPSTLTNEAKNSNSLSFTHKELKCTQYLQRPGTEWRRSLLSPRTCWHIQYFSSAGCGMSIVSHHVTLILFLRLHNAVTHCRAAEKFKERERFRHWKNLESWSLRGRQEGWMVSKSWLHNFHHMNWSQHSYSLNGLDLWI